MNIMCCNQIHRIPSTFPFPTLCVGFKNPKSSQCYLYIHDVEAKSWSMVASLTLPPSEATVEPARLHPMQESWRDHVKVMCVQSQVL